VLTSSRCSLRWQPHSRIIPVSRARCTQPGPARVMSASWKARSANHNAKCLPPWPRSVGRSADFLAARAGRKQQRLRKCCGPKQPAASGYWLALSSPSSWATTRLRDASERMKTEQVGPHFCAPQPAARILGRATACSQSVLCCRPRAKARVGRRSLAGLGARSTFPWCLRVGRTRRCGYSSPECAAGVPSDAGRRRRPDHDRDHRGRWVHRNDSARLRIGIGALVLGIIIVAGRVVLLVVGIPM
jgi:hypothetical protein